MSQELKKMQSKKAKKAKNLEIVLFSGKLPQVPAPAGQKMMFEATFITLMRQAFNLYLNKFGKLPKSLADMQRALPPVRSNAEITALAKSLLTASLRDTTLHQLHPRLFTIVFACCGEIVKHSNVYTTSYCHIGIGYLSQNFIDRFTRGKSQDEYDEVLYENFSIYGNIVRGYVEGDFVEVISKVE
jgi:hypothetical protein